MINTIFEIFQSSCLILAAILIIIASIGILRLKSDMDKVIYVRLHLLGIVDVAGVLAMIGLDQPLLAGIYFILAPIAGHAIANAYYYGEESHNQRFKIEYDLEDNHENNGILLHTKFKEELVGSEDERYTISKLNIINED